MNKKRKKQMIITTFITLIPAIAGLLMWNQLPDRIAIHFNTQGIANGWSGKGFVVLGMPLIMAALHLFTIFAVINDPKGKNTNKKIMTVCFWIVPIISCVVMGAVYCIAFGTALNIIMAVDLLVGVLFLILGNYMTKTRQNYTIGIKLPWTLNSRENWNKTHRLGGVLFMLTGITFIISGFTAYDYIAWIMTAVSVIVPIFYSFILYKKGI